MRLVGPEAPTGLRPRPADLTVHGLEAAKKGKAGHRIHDLSHTCERTPRMRAHAQPTNKGSSTGARQRMTARTTPTIGPGEADTQTGDLVGDFPGAFSHIGLVNASWTIHQAESWATAAGANDLRRCPDPHQSLRWVCGVKERSRTLRRPGYATPRQRLTRLLPQEELAGIS